MHPFRTAIEARDIDAAVALLADDVLFRSPVVFTPYRGSAAVASILYAVFEVFEDFRYTREIGASDEHVLVFETRIGRVTAEGADILRLGEDGKITEFVVMVRPLNAGIALAEAMAVRLAAKKV